MLFIAIIILLVNRVIWLDLKEGNSFSICLIKGSITLCLGISISLFLLNSLYSINLIKLWQQEFDKSIEHTVFLYRQLGWPKAELDRALVILRLLLIDLIWGWVVVLAISASSFFYLVQKKIFPNLVGSKLKIKGFKYWQIPYSMIWLWLAGMFFIVIGQWQTGVYTIIGKNIVFVLTIFYLLIGIAIIFFYLEKKKLANYFKFVVIFSLVFFPALIFLVSALGILDTWINWRKLRR